MASTLILNSATTKDWIMRGTPVFRASLRVGVPTTKSTAGNPNLTILAPSQQGGTTETVNGIAFWQGEPFSAAETKYQGDYLSDNSGSYGITFMAFSKNQYVSNVNLNVGSNDTGSTDYSDSIHVVTSPKAGNYPNLLTTNDMTFSNNTITTADTANQVGDLVVFGSDKVAAGLVYSMALTSKVTQNLAGFITPRSTVPTLTMDGNTVNTGGGNDTIAFANPKSVLSNNTFNVNGGSDYIFFADATDIKLGNVINLGASDGASDTLAFNYTTSFDKTGLAPGAMLTVNNFESGDKFYYKGVVYNDTASINAKMATDGLAGRIVFT